MSKKTFTDVMSNSEIQKSKISTLTNRPNDSIVYGGNGMSAADLKARFDALTSTLIDKTNARWKLFNTAGAEGIAGYIPISSSESLSDMVTAMESGMYAYKFKVPVTNNTPVSLENRFSTIDSRLEDLEGDFDSYIEGYRPLTNEDYIVITTDGKLTFASDVISSLTHADSCDANVQADWNDSDTTSDSYIKNKPTLGTASTKDVGTSQGNVVELGAGGKLPTSVLPAVAISDVFTVASEEAMLGLTAQRGDVCIRTDVTLTYILASEPASTLANWKQLQFPGLPTNTVASINGQTGIVVLTASDVGAPSMSQHNAKQDKLTAGSCVTIANNEISVNNTSSVTENSTNLVTSGGVYSAIKNAIKDEVVISNTQPTDANVDVWIDTTQETPEIYTKTEVNTLVQTASAYATQTTKGTARMWTTVEDGKVVLNIATEDA